MALEVYFAKKVGSSLKDSKLLSRVPSSGKKPFLATSEQLNIKKNHLHWGVFLWFNDP
jgi:hypothetical protein